MTLAVGDEVKPDNKEQRVVGFNVGGWQSQKCTWCDQCKITSI
jgi:hypothetical protein